MALVNLKSQYTSLNWSYNNQEDTTVHTDYRPENVPAQEKFNLLPSVNQFAFYRRNEANIGLDQVKSVSQRGNRNGLGNLKTGLKSLAFGSDQPGGGWSGQPFITFDQDGDALFNQVSIRDRAQGQVGLISTKGTSLVDFPKRGGDYPSNQIDLKRVESFLNTPKGQLFLEKQKALQFMNPRTETGTSMKTSTDPRTLPGLIENTRVYSQENMLNQVKVQGTGGHVSRIGASNLAIQDDFYANTVGLQNVTNSSALNRLAILHRLKIAKSNANMFSSLDQFLGATESTLAARSLGISTNQTLLFNYPGGPNSGAGFGNTTIGRYVDTTLNTTFNPLPTVMSYAQIAQQNPIKNGPVTSDSIKDFRSGSVGYPRTLADSSVIWKNQQTIENRLKTSVPINTSSDKADYSSSVKMDELSMLNPVLFNSGISDPYKLESGEITDYYRKDMIKFGFECMSNDNSSESTLLLFRAFLTNGFTDNNTAVLNSFRYMGRGEEFHTYQGFTRQIGFSFKIAVRSRIELKPLYSKLNYLISQVYPDYSPNTNVMRAPLVKLTIGDYLYRVPGFLENINVTVDNNSPWEINLEEYDDVQQLPHVVEVSVSFKPIMSILPRRQTTTNVNLITNNFTTPAVSGRRTVATNSIA
jgi:hypothetical protein